MDTPNPRSLRCQGYILCLGANPNAFTGYDMTAYHFYCTEHFEESLRLLLEFVSTPWFTEETVAREQGIIGQEIDMVADGPENRLYENLVAAMYAAHPVRTPILGSRESIAQITPELLELCHRSFYCPSNMMLCIVGDVDPETVEAMAMEVLGSEKRLPAQKHSHWEEEMVCPQHEIREQMEVSMPMFQIGFKSEDPGKGENATRMEIVGDLAAEALFGESSQLYLELYEKGIIDSSFSGGFETLEGMSMLIAAGDSDFPEVIRDAILERAKTLTLEETDFLRMKRSSLGRRIRELDSFDSTCFRVCAYHFSEFDYFDFPRVFHSVTAEEVLDFIRRTVTPQRCCLSVIEPLQQEVTK